MKGKLYSSQECRRCGSKFVWNGDNGLYCPNHPKEKATGGFILRYGRAIFKRFDTYLEAEDYLLGMRHEDREGRFDRRNYMQSRPLGFANLADTWLKRKKAEVRNGHIKAKTLKGLQAHIDHARKAWENKNIKTIGFPELDDFLKPVEETEPLFGLSAKTRANVRSTLHSFFAWCVDRGYLEKMPKFPEINFTLKYRKIVPKELQKKILAKIKELTYHINPKIWLAVKWLATYFNLRPGELLNIKEKDVDLAMGRILIPDPKERKPKFVYLIEEDIELLRSMPRGFPELHFFRHTKGNGGAKPGQKFGKCFLYNSWKRATAALGITNVDLYAGTRHSTMVHLRKKHTPEEIKRGSGHSTNRALERYLQVTAEELRPLYAAANPDTRAIHRLERTGTENGKDFNR